MAVPCSVIFIRYFIAASICGVWVSGGFLGLAGVSAG